MYAIEQKSASEIARYLTDRRIPNSRGNTVWSSSSIIKLLKNEKYVGDLVQKKTYTTDYLTHEKRTNHGEIPKITIRNHHEPIISRELWDLTCKTLEKNCRHGSKGSGYSNRYAFSGKIRCGECGAIFVSRIRHLDNGGIKRRWRCSAASAEGSTIEYDEQGKQHGCDVSMLLSDDCAWDLLHTALISILSASTDVIQPLLFAIKSAIAGDKSGEYDGNRTNDIEQILSQLLTGETKSDVFCKAVLDCITVFKDKHIELQLIHLPYRFIFQSTKKRHS